tara:strand:+ start:220 stop:546 length:327 start_codon:yes stop_codon:yes gene_type:complete
MKNLWWVLYIAIFVFGYCMPIYINAKNCIKSGNNKFLSYLITTFFVSYLWLSVGVLFWLIPFSYDLATKYGLNIWLAIPLNMILTILFIGLIVFPVGYFYYQFENKKK